jgi:hypothetical protein
MTSQANQAAALSAMASGAPYFIVYLPLFVQQKLIYAAFVHIVKNN